MSNYLIRQMPIWNNPHWLSGLWRAFVHKQPIAVLCGDAISSYIPVLRLGYCGAKSDQQDEFKEDINITLVCLRGKRILYGHRVFQSRRVFGQGFI